MVLLKEAVSLMCSVVEAASEVTINRNQSWLVASACTNVESCMQAWLSDPNFELRADLARELLRVLRNCLRLVWMYQGQDWLKAVLFSQENELEFQVAVEDLNSCVELMNQALILYNEDRSKLKLICSLRRNALESAALNRNNLSIAAEADRKELEVRLKKSAAAAGLSAEESAVAQLLLKKLNRDSSKVDAGIRGIDIKHLENIRRGAFGRVSKVMFFGTLLAAKRTDPRYVETELEAMWKLRPGHPCVLPILGKTSSDALIMELCRTDLRELVRSSRFNPPFSLQVSLEIMLQIARGMEFLHQRGLVHRDLKPANVLVNFEGPVFPYYEPSGWFCCKVADFGSEFETSDSSIYSHGTCRYTAPEVFGAGGLEGGHYGPKVDVYSFAMTCSEIITGSIPFRHKPWLRSQLLMLMISKGERPELPRHVPSGLRSLITKCWRLEPGRRPNFSKIVSSLLSIKSQLLLHHYPLPRTKPVLQGELLEPGTSSRDLVHQELATSPATKRLLVEVWNATNLMGKDGATAYCVVEYDGQIRRAEPKTKDLNRAWNVIVEFKVSGPLEAGMIEINVLCDKKAGSKQPAQFLGRVRIPGASVAKRGKEAMVYHSLSKCFSGAFSGALCSHIEREIGVRAWWTNEPPAEPGWRRRRLDRGEENREPLHNLSC